MRVFHASIPRAAAVLAVVWPLVSARAAAAQQMASAVRATPSACVRAAGPDVAAAPRDTPPRATRAPGDTLPVAIRLDVSVHADEVRFERSPVVCVTLSGDARLDSVHVLARRNLATPVVRNTTYRDVYVAVEILGRLNADCVSAAITGARVAGADSTSTGRCASIDARTRPRGSSQ